MKNVIITYGLPASGKSTELKENYSKYFLISVDEYLNKSFKEIKSKILQHIKDKKHDLFAIDILVTTNEALRNVVDTVLESKLDVQFTIVVFHEDRNNSVLNDKFRNRYTKAQTSIEKMPYEKIDESLFSDVNIKFVYKPTYVLNDWKLKSIELKIHLKEEKYLISESWSLGGEWWSYTDARGTISAEEPIEFNEFDELMEKLNPSISFLEYKKLKRECVSMEEYQNGDYYSNETKARWICDMEKLFKLMSL